MLHREIFNSIRKSRFERQIEFALITRNYTNLGDNCTSMNYDRYRQLNMERHGKLLKGIDTFNTLRLLNIGLIILVCKTFYKFQFNIRDFLHNGEYWVGKKVFIGFSKSILLTIKKANYSI
jgi:hypothetical protein